MLPSSERNVEICVNSCREATEYEVKLKCVYPSIKYKACSKKYRTFAIKNVLLILQYFKRCPLQSSPLYWRYTVSNISSIVGARPVTHFL